MPEETNGELSADERKKVVQSAVRVTIPDTSGQKRKVRKAADQTA